MRHTIPTTKLSMKWINTFPSPNPDSGRLVTALIRLGIASPNSPASIPASEFFAASFSAKISVLGIVMYSVGTKRLLKGLVTGMHLLFGEEVKNRERVSPNIATVLTRQHNYRHPRGGNLLLHSGSSPALSKNIQSFFPQDTQTTHAPRSERASTTFDLSSSKGRSIN